jgi:hypothetical protein
MSRYVKKITISSVYNRTSIILYRR